MRKKPLAHHHGRASRKAAAPFRCRLVILAKLPVAGRVKTRLARETGVAEAVRFYRTTALTVIARLARQPFWETIVAVAPDTARASPVWPRFVTLAGQGAGDIAARMQRPMRELPPGPVCVIGTDIPGITAAQVRRAFRLLGARTCVFGPAEDGGFWLVGMRRRPRLIDPYRGVRWSSPATLADVLANLDPASVGFTTTLHDVDAACDLRRAGPQLGRRVPENGG